MSYSTAPNPPPVTKKPTPWKVIIPVAVLVILCCLFLVIVFGIAWFYGTRGQGPLEFLATDTPTRTPTNTFTPTPEIIEVAIFDFDNTGEISYWSGGIGNNVGTWVDILNADPEYRFSTHQVTDLSLSTLGAYSRLILPDNAIPDYYLADVQSWLMTGDHTIIAADSAITYISYSGFMWSESTYSNGEDVYWDYSSDSDDMYMILGPITEDVYTSAVLGSAAGDARMFRSWLPYDAVVLAESSSDSSMVYAACRNIPAGGAIFVLGPFEDPAIDLHPFIQSVVYASYCQ